MAKVKGSTAEALAQDLARLRGLQEEARGRIAGLEREMVLLEERDATLAREGFAGRDVAKERAKIRETVDGKARDLARERRDLGILDQEVARVEGEHAEAARAAEEEWLRVEGAALNDAGGAAAKAVEADLLRHLEVLRPLQIRDGDLVRRWGKADKGTFGNDGVRAMRLAVGAIEQALAMIREGGR